MALLASHSSSQYLPFCTSCVDLIAKGSIWSLDLLGLDLVNLYLPFSKQEHGNLLQFQLFYQIALMDYVGDASCNLSKEPHLTLFSVVPISFCSTISKTPIPQALMVFSDSSSSRDVISYKQRHWIVKYTLPQKTAQHSKLAVIIFALYRVTLNP